MLFNDSNFTKVFLKKIENLQASLDELLSKKVLTWEYSNQICLTSPKGYEDDCYLGSGSLYYDWRNVVSSNLDNIPIRKNKFEEFSFTELCNIFYNSVFEDLYNAINEKFYCGRIRFIRMMPKTCMTWHYDDTFRLHYPLKTQEGCLMIINDEVMHIPKEEWWLTNTKIKHTALNSSKQDRIHLVASVLGFKNAD